jgi:hypothetical protein
MSDCLELFVPHKGMKRNQVGASSRYTAKPLAVSPIQQFSRIVFFEFLRNQRVFSQGDEAKGGLEASQAFRSLVLALSEKAVSEAIRWRKTFYRLCRSRHVSARGFMRLAVAEGIWACQISGQKPPRHATLQKIFGMAAANHGRTRGKSFAVPRCRGAAATACRAFREFTEREAAYAALPVRHCTVCATVSAGKSTFINALLGCDVLPARNEATTAKITSVYDCDGDMDVAGFFRCADGTTGGHSPEVSLAMLDAWNRDASVSEIHLRGDFDGIRNRGMAVAMHDTPGTSNSADPSHRRMTLDFLSSTPPDLVLVVLDAKYPGTTDERSLLKAVARKTRGIPILFVFNKAEKETEDLAGVMARSRVRLEELGYKNPTILPVSSLAARLFKMAIQGRGAEMTEKEQDEFSVLASKFRKLDLSGAAGTGEKATSSIPHREAFSGGFPPDVLERTGIVRIERWIEAALSDKKGTRE